LDCQGHQSQGRPHRQGKGKSMRKKKEIGLEEITLKDFIAIFAMQALLSDSDWRSDMDFNDTALAAFSMANEMMEARNGN